jgi:ABC-type phosphate/phosphonate transport system substrate-binding protein
VQLVATPCYGVPGCAGANYSSAVIVHRSNPAAGLDDLATARCGTVAANALDSQSGYWALRAALVGVSALPPERVVLTGGHRATLLAVARGEADLASIDAICWALAQRHEPAAAADLRMIGFTPSAPGLPFITGIDTPPATVACLRKALAAVALGPAGSEFREHLFLTGAHVLPVSDYDRILRLAAVARQAVWPEPAA